MNRSAVILMAVALAGCSDGSECVALGQRLEAVEQKTDLYDTEIATLKAQVAELQDVDGAAPRPANAQPDEAVAADSIPPADIH